MRSAFNPCFVMFCYRNGPTEAPKGVCVILFLDNIKFLHCSGVPNAKALAFLIT